jgi:hypothetical protein
MLAGLFARLSSDVAAVNSRLTLVAALTITATIGAGGSKPVNRSLLALLERLEASDRFVGERVVTCIIEGIFTNRGNCRKPSG